MKWFPHGVEHLRFGDRQTANEIAEERCLRHYQNDTSRFGQLCELLGRRFSNCSRAVGYTENGFYGIE